MMDLCSKAEKVYSNKNFAMERSCNLRNKKKKVNWHSNKRYKTCDCAGSKKNLHICIMENLVHSSRGYNGFYSDSRRVFLFFFSNLFMKVINRCSRLYVVPLEEMRLDNERLLVVTDRWAQYIHTGLFFSSIGCAGPVYALVYSLARPPAKGVTLARGLLSALFLFYRRKPDYGQFRFYI